ncbi:hypothetical protein J2X31_002750 [Flavobacterium arsenatis]|uniref:Uncharacterized protein n=1 Tax=Flavobacterium arsenatis TaxID=1484332 RepID=A0ABU1TS70_9FLAO|nr:hypothetical protein [Flavobacterium arsenatis]MDR6968724.1 hypothetical protein [Flavobacterium arsenatis]
MEILDHMILSVEAILDSDKTISFEKAVDRAKIEGFGNEGYIGIMEEKVKLAHKKIRNENFKMIKDYFTFPKIVFTCFIAISYFIFLSFFENPSKANYIAIIIVGFTGISQMLYSWKYRKCNKLYVLKTDILNRAYFLSFFGVQITQVYVSFGKEYIDFNHIFMRLLMTFIFTFSVLAVLGYIEIRKKTIVELKQQIFI